MSTSGYFSDAEVFKPGSVQTGKRPRPRRVQTGKRPDREVSPTGKCPDWEVSRPGSVPDREVSRPGSVRTSRSGHFPVGKIFWCNSITRYVWGLTFYGNIFEEYHYIYLTFLRNNPNVAHFFCRGVALLRFLQLYIFAQKCEFRNGKKTFFTFWHFFQLFSQATFFSSASFYTLNVTVKETSENFENMRKRFLEPKTI